MLRTLVGTWTRNAGLGLSPLLLTLSFLTGFCGADDKDPSAPDAQAAALLHGVAALPPSVKPGECYALVRYAAQFESIQERVLVKPEVVRYEIVPAEFKEVEKEVIVKPETVSYEIIPAQFESKEIEVVVAPEFTKLSATEPVLQAEERKLETRPGRLGLRLDANPFDLGSQISGGVLNLFQDPGETTAYKRNLLIKPASVAQEKVARAVEKVVTQVLVKPAEVKEVKVPAEIKKVKVRELVRPSTKKEVKTPAEYGTVTFQKLIAPEKIVWQRVLCSTKLNAPMLTEIQNKLKEKGVDPGTANGELNEATKNAIAKYQANHRLAEGGLTYEFLEHLGVKAPE